MIGQLLGKSVFFFVCVWCAGQGALVGSLDTAFRHLELRAHRCVQIRMFVQTLGNAFFLPRVVGKGRRESFF